MKKLVAYILFLGVLVSCSENVEFNNDPAIQGLKDNVLWESYTTSAVATESNITIVGTGGNQTVTLKMELPDNFITQTEELTYISYELGTGFANQASYTTVINGIDYLYQTGAETGDGEIVVTDYDGVTVSGTFRFNAVNADPDSDQPEIVNFSKGNFYKIPVVHN